MMVSGQVQIGTGESRLHSASGEELLLLAAFGGNELRRSVDRELDRRAMVGPPVRRKTARMAAARAA